MFKNKNKNKDNTKIRTGSFTLKTIPVRENGDNYYYIENFEQANEKQCKEYDKLNQLIFQKYNGIYDKISNKIGNCHFKLDKKPDPPKSPNNYESLIKWRAMNSLKNVSQQTIATLYLLKHNFNITLDFDKDGIKPSEIIDIALQETNNDLELMKKESYVFLQKKYQEKINNNNNNNNDNNNNPNIKNLRYQSKNFGCISDNSETDNLSSSSSSIEIDYGFSNSNYPLTTTSQTDNNNNNINTPNNNIIKKISKVNLRMVPQTQYNNQYIEQTIQKSLQQLQYNLPKNNINMKCDRPEHHAINKKVSHFDNLHSTINNSNYNPNPNINNNLLPTPTAPPDYNY